MPEYCRKTRQSQKQHKASPVWSRTIGWYWETNTRLRNASPDAHETPESICLAFCILGWLEDLEELCSCERTQGYELQMAKENSPSWVTDITLRTKSSGNIYGNVGSELLLTKQCSAASTEVVALHKIETYLCLPVSWCLLKSGENTGGGTRTIPSGEESEWTPMGSQPQQRRQLLQPWSCTEEKNS